jgi:hypothetical protein
MTIFPAGTDPRGDPTGTGQGRRQNFPREGCGAGPRNVIGAEAGGELLPAGTPWGPASDCGPFKIAARQPNKHIYNLPAASSKP